MSQETFAEQAGIMGATLSRYELGSLYPSLRTLLRLCDALPVTADWLLGLSEEGGP